MYEHVVAESTATDGTPFRVILEPDASGFNPRDDYSNAGRIVALHGGRVENPQEDGADRYSRANAASIVDAIQDHDFRVVDRWLRIFHGATVVLPLQNGTDGLTIDTYAPESLRADEYVGVTFDTPQTRWDTVGKGLIPAEDETPTMARALAADVETYRQWASGDVWGYRVQTAATDLRTGESIDWQDTDDSCWGFIGQQWAEEAATEALDYAVAAHDADLDEQAEAAAELDEEIDDLRRTELGIPA